MNILSIVLSVIATAISLAAFVFSIIKYKSEQRAALHIRCMFNKFDHQLCEIENGTPNSAKNVKITILDDKYTFDSVQRKSIISIGNLAAQNTYNFSIYRKFEKLDIEFSIVRVRVEWQDKFKKHNIETMNIQIPEQRGFASK